MQKTCVKCGGTDFTASLKCRACRKVIGEKYRANNKEKVRAANAKWEMDNREKRLSRIRDSAKENQRKKKWRTEHRELQRSLISAWHAKNPDAWRIYAQNRRARQRLLGGGLSKGLLAKLLKLQRGRCACCGCDLSKITPHLDHVVALKNGGAHDDSNIQVLCQSCNNEKHIKDPIIFMQSRGFLL
jgi:5-methylcytosine-specific restriction endonuclease McrA